MSCSTPARPAPETAWYELTMRRLRPKASASGFNTGMIAIVVQFGLATMPAGISSRSSGFTSATTSGTSSCMRHCEELSITMAPASANLGAHCFDVPPPAEKIAMSMPLRSAVATSSTVMSWPRQLSVWPAERAEARKRRSLIGKSRSSSTRRMTMPTWPVAPSTATLTPRSLICTIAGLLYRICPVVPCTVCRWFSGPCRRRRPLPPGPRRDRRRYAAP